MAAGSEFNRKISEVLCRCSDIRIKTLV